MQPMIAPRRITDDNRNHTEPNKGVRFLLWFRFHTVFLTLLLFVPTQAQTQGQTQAQAQAQAQTDYSAPPESAEPVPTLTRESFESLPPGRYFLQINPKLCHQVEHCCGFNPTWDALASQLKDNAHYAGNMFRIECADDPDFCDKLLGSYFMERRSANIFITLVAVETDADANTDTGNIVRMEYFLRDMVPEELIAWLAGFVNKRLMPMSLPPGMAAASLSSSNANTNNPPSSSSIAMLMLSMDGLGVRSDVWCRFLTLAVEQGIDAKLYVHDMLVAGHPPGHLYCPRPEHALANAAILAIPAPFLQFTSWATISLVKTVVVMLRASMLFGGADWYAIVSDNSVPLVDPRTMVARLSGPGFVAPDGSTASVFQNMDPGRPHPKEVEDRRLFIRPPYRLPPSSSSSSSSSSSEEPRSQSQLQSPRPLELSPSDFTVAEFWSILDRRAGAWFAEHEHFSDFEMTFAPDDTYFVSLAKVYGLPLRIASAHRYPSPEEEEGGGGGGGGVPPKVETEAHGMYTAWSTNLHHPHPEVLSEISPETIQEWSQGDRHSFLFARKISDTTTIDLPWLGQDYDGTHDEL